jgi:acyl carrier protein
MSGEQILDATSIASTIRNYICERFQVPTGDADFSDDVHLFDYGYVDSFGAVDLTSFVESQFDVRISEGDMIIHPLNTVNEIATFVTRRRSGEI